MHSSFRCSSTKEITYEINCSNCPLNRQRIEIDGVSNGTRDYSTFARYDFGHQGVISDIVENPAAYVCDLGHELILAAAGGKGELSERAKAALRTHAGRREALDLLPK